jgi:glycosyltransferase involved in cell wall biosynthesis
LPGTGPFTDGSDRVRVLNVVPGSVLPLDRGANRRVYELTRHLNRSGIPTDLLIGVRSGSKASRLSRTLREIAPEVHTYRKRRRRLPWRMRVRKEVERLVRLTRGIWRPAPDLFVERLATRAGSDGSRRLAELVATGRYTTVIVNYAWMSGMAEEARRVRPHPRWICDTHDVQFLRSSTLEGKGPRLWVGEDDERDAEMAELRRYDAILAISDADREAFQRYLPEVPVVAAPAAFDYARLELPAEATQPPYRYGFLGWKMSANVMALDFLMREWWPHLLEISPGSRLAVAGSVCRRGGAKRAIRGHPEVSALGFVPSLRTFYEGVDIVLNPVVVQGGLNFKSVEAMAAGRLLVTTSRGALCLGEGAPVVVADRGSALVERLAPLVRDPEALQRIRRQAQEWALDRFGEERAYRELRELLREARP